MRLDLRHTWSQFSSGVVRHSAYFRVISIPATDFRSAIVVSAKVSPTAVGRNHLKRQVRSIARTIKNPPRGWYMLYAKPSALTARYDQLEQDITKTLAGTRNTSH